jgi:hypothetical protein
MKRNSVRSTFSREGKSLSNLQDCIDFLILKLVKKGKLGK